MMTRTEIHLFRHGETEWNRLGLMQGHRDSALTTRGVQQAKRKAGMLAGISFDVAIASSSGRAQDTARLLAENSSIEVQAMDALLEINLGAWEGCLKTDVAASHPDEYHKFWHDPANYQSVGGETFHELWRRTSQAIFDLVDQHQGQTILVVSHAASVKAIVTRFSGRNLEQIWDPPVADNLSHSKLVATGSNIEVVQFCDKAWPGEG